MKKMKDARSGSRLMVALPLAALAGGALLTAGVPGAPWTQPARVEAKPRSKGIAWQPSMQAAMKEARRTGKPIMVDFYATWCGPCQMLDKETYTNAAVIREARNFVSVKVDVDKHQKLARQYKVTSIPVVAFLRPNGTVATSSLGFVEARDMVKLMKQARAKAAKKPAISA